MRYSRAIISSLVVCLNGAAFSQAQASQDYPSRPIRLIVPFVAGGVTDVAARLVADRLGKSLGQPIVVDNRPGASGNIGAQAVAKAKADGYTLLLGFDGALVTSPHFVKPPFDVLTDFAPVTKIGDAALIFVTNPSIPVKNFQQLIAYAGTQKEQGLSYGSSGTGTTCHLAGELLKQRAQIDLIHVPYKGGSQALTDVMGGALPVLCTAVASTAQYVKSGRVIPIAVTGLARSATLPDVPTLSESGVANFDINSWVGILAPANTSAAVVNKLHREIRAIVDEPEMRGRLLELGITPVGNSPAEFKRQIRMDYKKYGDLMTGTEVKLK